MANFCTNCGAPMEEGANFCTTCGASSYVEDMQPDPAPQPQIPVNRTQQFIQNRRQQMGQAPHQPQQAAYQAGQSPYGQQTAAAGQRQQQAKKQAKSGKKGKRFVAVLLILATLGGLWYTGFKNPGFLVEKEDPWATQTTTKSGSGTSESKAEGDISDALSHNAQEDTDWENLDYSQLAQEEESGISTDPKDCKLVFDAKTIQNAPAQTAQVSRSDPRADFGDVSVYLKSWNLDNAEDELTVKSLGEISEGEEGWSIIGYDLSLASGQNTFDTNVEITIPRTATSDEIGTCVTYNEESGQWEEIYATVINDGKSYLIKTNHFSIKGEKKLKYVYTGGSLKKTDGTTVEIDNGLFHERYDPKKGTRMQSYVFADRDLLWAMYLAKDGDTINQLMTSIKDLKEADINALQHQAASERDAASLFIGTAGGLDNLNTLMGSIGYNAPFLGLFLTSADVALCLMNIQATAEEEGKTFAEGLWEAIQTNKKGIGDVVFSAVMTLGTAAVYGNWAGALVGVAIWAGTKIVDAAMEPAAWDVTDTPEWGDLYKVFYLTSGAKVTIDSKNAKNAIEKNKYTYASMKRPKSFTEEQWAALAKVINKKPLRVEEVYDEDAGAYRYDFINFAPAFAKIIEMFYDKPYDMEKAIEDFYKAYANAMWNLPDKNLYNFAKAQCKLGAGTEYFKEEFTLAGDLRRPDKEDRIAWRDDMVSFVRARTAEQLEDAMDMALYNTYSTVTQNMNRLEKLLNIQLVFHVEDQTLLPGQTFKDSIYCVDWQKIPQNEEYLPKNNKDKSGGYDDPELVTPMRFVCDESPLFKPMEGVKGPDGKIVNVNIPYTEYYPYVPDFLPRARKNQKDDIVYTCTLYHYLMMGAPTQMKFKDCSDPEHFLDMEWVIADIEFPEIKEGMTRADVKIKIDSGNDIAVLEGMWGPAPNGSPYEKKESGQVNLIVEEKGKHNTFLSELASQKPCSYHEGGSMDDSKFVYTRNVKKEGEKQTGVLTIWKPKGELEDRLSFTVEEVEDGVIYLKEWKIYLVRFDTTAGQYTLKIDKDNLASGDIILPNATATVDKDGNVTITVAAVKDASYTKQGDGSTTRVTINRSSFTIKAKKSSMMDDVPYGYDVAIGKCYTITSMTEKVEAHTDSVYKSNKEGEPEIPSSSHSVLHDFILARGQEEEASCSYVVLYYDCKDTSKLLFIQVYLDCLSDYTHIRKGHEESKYKDSKKTYYLQMQVQ